jgi:2'-5' RNA ligase
VLRVLRSAGRKLRDAVRARGGWSPDESEHLDLAYVILVSEDLHNYMRRLQLRILREYGATFGVEVSPHITLKQAFPARDVDPFERYFDRLVAGIEPFEITVRGVGFFDRGVAFMDVVPSGPLDALRRRVVRDLSTEFGVEANEFEDDRYHFHATLAQGIPSTSLERARRQLGSIQAEFRFVCDTLGLLSHTGRGWITYKRSTISTTRSHPTRP